VGGPQGDGNDQLVNMERLKFSDKSVAIDLDGNAGNAARTLATVLGKDAVKNSTYAGIAISLFDQGMTKDQVNQVALNARLGANAKSTDVVKLLWKNLFNADIDASNLAYYSGLIDSKAMTAAQLTTLAADLDLTAQLIDLAGLSKTGWEYVPFGT
ncbi:MAG: matrixin, partial [Betaproteobacteria bacterium]|nr:matrixin [Betaproteobacteria bacterium]